MVSDPKNWWHRLKNTLARARRNSDPYNLPPVGQDGLLVGPAETVAEEADLTMDKPAGLVRWPRRDQALLQLQEGYERVTRLIDEIQRHMVEQAERADRTCKAVEQLARTLADQPDMCRQQTQMLESIAGQLESTTSHTQRLTEAISEIPRVTRGQTEALANISRQLEMVGEQNVVSNQTLDRLGNAVAGVGQASSSQTDLLREMGLKTDEQSGMIRSLITTQGRRFIMLFVVTLALALTTIVAAIVSIAMRH
ncbi:MAG TPA: hypothetical protein PKY77_15720 [Phycisphaerae bacterium]|nr:hypothetical protein [Phycisphaerae bacterium]HRY66858.1 hypothetical protein [Phycisphaerae bacterium]HSA26916.1 hypothetical protein [Phycisphaerae bacterium]